MVPKKKKNIANVHMGNLVQNFAPYFYSYFLSILRRLSFDGPRKKKSQAPSFFSLLPTKHIFHSFSFLFSIHLKTPHSNKLLWFRLYLIWAERESMRHHGSLYRCGASICGPWLNPFEGRTGQHVGPTFAMSIIKCHPFPC